MIQLGGWATIATVRRYAKVNVVKLSPKVRKALTNGPTGSDFKLPAACIR